MSSVLTVDGPLTVPTVDISPYRNTNSTAARRGRVAAAVDQAARSVGLMQVVGHGIPDATLTAFTTALDAFFALDGDAKEAAYRCPPEVNRGYPPRKAEAFGEQPRAGECRRSVRGLQRGSQTGDHPGPSQPPKDHPTTCGPREVATFRAGDEGRFVAAAGVARIVVRSFGQALGGCRARARSAGEGRPHRLRHRHGAVGRPTMWISTMHRVAPSVVVDGVLVPRRSAAFFHDGNVEATIAPPPTCVSPEAPALYEPATVDRRRRAKLAGSRSRVLNLAAAREAARLGGTTSTG